MAAKKPATPKTPEAVKPETPATPATPVTPVVDETPETPVPVPAKLNVKHKKSGKTHEVSKAYYERNRSVLERI